MFAINIIYYYNKTIKEDTNMEDKLKLNRVWAYNILINNFETTLRKLLILTNKN